MVKPFLKWIGGKRQLLPELKKYIPEKFQIYYEPFVGAGALFFHLQPKRAVVNDYNKELINCYHAIRDKVTEVIEYLDTFENNEETYYKIRNMDRLDNWHNYPDAFKAARTIYLNRTCFNGLYRVNSQGYFNVPYGKHKNPFIPEKDTLIDVSNYLKTNNIEIHNVDFADVVSSATKYDFIYFDPPYDPVSDTSNFTSYTSNGFAKQDQIRLRNCFEELTKKGCKCMLSNSATDFIKDLYKDFKIIEVQAKRSINCKGNKRGKIPEVIIMNYFS